MVTTTTRTYPDNGQLAGIPSQWRETWPDASTPLLTGHEPAFLTVDFKVPDNIDWPALTVLAIDSTTKLARIATKTTGAAMVLLVPIKLAAGETGKKAPVVRAGCLNPDVLKWDASFSTLDDRIAAFDGAPSPTSIVIRPIQAYSDEQPFAP